MNKERKEPDYPVELESQFIMRWPEEPAKTLRDVLSTGETLKNRLTIQMENDMRNGEIRFDHWLLHAKIVDLPTIVESHKTIDRKSVYKTADICQIMICKDEIDPSSTEEESPTKSKKKDPFKVDKKFLWPHGITPPTKNIRKRRFRKTLKKKNVEAPEIEKEVKRLLRADNEAVSFTWEVINEEDENGDKPEIQLPLKPEKLKAKKEHISTKSELNISHKSASKVEDIFGGTLSDSDLEDENVNVDIDDSRLSCYDDPRSDSLHELDIKSTRTATQFSSEMFYSTDELQGTSGTTNLMVMKNREHYSIDEFLGGTEHKSNAKLQQLTTELEELKQRRQRTQFEISGMENMTLRQRFQDILQNLNKDITSKQLEYQKLLSLNK
ncbi:unnamed protein product [Chilo suppressalis]|uniref:TAFII55 protein conserved region domain-containing protein n=1 Tax=Chilo suppressalis TaxID=168631 RepID=A0ABN8BDL1_CHISP|nr:unnamed protein product [Chilo suppressalis]